MALRTLWAHDSYGKDYEQLSAGQRGELDGRLKAEMRRNSYDAQTGVVTLSPQRAAAVEQVRQHYLGLFGSNPAFDKLREQYAMRAGRLTDAADLQALPAFIFWSAWSAATDRPGEANLSYTSNWPHEPLVGNTPTAGTGIWSIASVILMIAAIGAISSSTRAARRRVTRCRPRPTRCSISSPRRP